MNAKSMMEKLAETAQGVCGMRRANADGPQSAEIGKTLDGIAMHLAALSGVLMRVLTGEGKAKKIKPKKSAENADENKKPAAVNPAFDVGANDKPTPLCCDCKEPFTKTSNVQKRCPECKVKHKQAYAKSYYRKTQEEKNPAATADWLARINALDKKMDTIS